MPQRIHAFGRHGDQQRLGAQVDQKKLTQSSRDQMHVLELQMRIDLMHLREQMVRKDIAADVLVALGVACSAPEHPEDEAANDAGHTAKHEKQRTDFAHLRPKDME